MNRVKTFIISVTCVGLYASCSASGREDVTATEVDSQRGSNVAAQVVSLCSLISQPASFDGKVIRIRTSLFRLTDVVSMGDESCIQPEPTVDVKFAADLDTAACDLLQTSRSLCSSLIYGKPEFTGVTMDGVYTGLFRRREPALREREQAFRFEFEVREINEITAVNRIRSSKLKFGY